MRARNFYWREESIKTRIETGIRWCWKAEINYIEEKNPLKQGLKQLGKVGYIGSHYIEEKNPLKQGLKLPVDISIGWIQRYWREESIKTRIET